MKLCSRKECQAVLTVCVRTNERMCPLLAHDLLQTGKRSKMQGQQMTKKTRTIGLCWQIALLQSQCSEVSNIQCTARLWSAHEDSFSSHYWGNHYFLITKWINKRTKQKCCFNFFEAVTAQHSLLSFCLHMNLEKLIASPDGCQKVKWKDSKNQIQYHQDCQRG